MFSTNAEVDAFHEVIYDRTSAEKVSVKAKSVVVGDVTSVIKEKTMLHLDSNKKYTMHMNTGGLKTKLKLAVGLHYDCTVNLDVEDGLINGATCTLKILNMNPIIQCLQYHGFSFLMLLLVKLEGKNIKTFFTNQSRDLGHLYLPSANQIKFISHKYIDILQWIPDNKAYSWKVNQGSWCLSSWLPFKRKRKGMKRKGVNENKNCKTKVININLASPLPLPTTTTATATTTTKLQQLPLQQQQSNQCCSWYKIPYRQWEIWSPSVSNWNQQCPSHRPGPRTTQVPPLGGTDIDTWPPPTGGALPALHFPFFNGQIFHYL